MPRVYDIEKAMARACYRRQVYQTKHHLERKKIEDLETEADTPTRNRELVILRAKLHAFKNYAISYNMERERYYRDLDFHWKHHPIKRVPINERECDSPCPVCNGPDLQQLEGSGSDDGEESPEVAVRADEWPWWKG
jgi:hypothetical protein